MSARRAVVIGALGGIGSALVEALRQNAWDVVGTSRDGRQGTLALDLGDEATIAAASAAVAGPIELVIVASGILAPIGRGPEKALRDVDPVAFAEVMTINAAGPLLVAKHFVPRLPRKGRSVFAALGARVGSIGDNRMGGWYSYRASKAALVMSMRTLAIEMARSRPEAICAALHPGTVDTALSSAFHARTPAKRLFAPVAAAEHTLGVLDNLGPNDSGGHFAWDGARIAP